MTCPKCGSDHVQVMVEQVSAKSSQKGNGCLWSFGRAILIICTFGLWLLVGKHRGTAKTQFVNKTVAVCQNCGNRWTVANK